MEGRIIRNLAVLGQKGIWSKELNVVRWYDMHDRFDIREWSADHRFINKGGITLSDDEMSNLKEAINSMYYSYTDDSE